MQVLSLLVSQGVVIQAVKSERSAASCAPLSYMFLKRPVRVEKGTMGGPTTQGSGVRQRHSGPKLRAGISVKDSTKPSCGTTGGNGDGCIWTKSARSPCMAT